MQMQSNFFYDSDFFVDIIASIVSGGEKSFCQNCNLLLDCLNNYKTSHLELEFSKYIQSKIRWEKLRNVEQCRMFIETLKKFPTTFAQWGPREKNMLELIFIPKKNTNSSYVRSYDDSYVNKRRKVLSNIADPVKEDYLTNKKEQVRKLPYRKNRTYDDSYVNKRRNMVLPNDANLIGKDLFDSKQDNVRGLPNVGLSCYMNSALQSLYHDRLFRNSVLKCIPSGVNKEKMQAVKEIFQYLNGNTNISKEKFVNLYNILGYSDRQEDSLDCKGFIEELFDRSKITTTNYKSRSVLMYYDIPKNLSEDIVLNNLVDKNSDNPKLPEKSIVDINIYRTKDENTGAVNKDYMDIPISLTFGKNTYSLVTISVHLGISSESGHYISYVRQGNLWKKINDSSVSNCRWEDIKDDVGKNCTFLRYEKI